jgi:hypothetical protein
MATALRDRVTNDAAITSSLDAAATFFAGAFAHPSEAPTFLMEGLLEAAKAVIVAALDVLDGVTVAVLAALEDAVLAFRQALTMPLDVPFVADLYRWAVTTHGTSRPEDTFSVLNLVGLLGAIPATVLSRLVSGVSPFASAATTARDAGAPEPEPEPEPEPDPDYAVKRDWGAVAGSLGMVSAALKAVLDIQVVAAPTGIGNYSIEYGAGEPIRIGGKWVTLTPGLDLRPAPAPAVHRLGDLQPGHRPDLPHGELARRCSVPRVRCQPRPRPHRPRGLLRRCGLDLRRVCLQRRRAQPVGSRHPYVADRRRRR